MGNTNSILDRLDAHTSKQVVPSLNVVQLNLGEILAEPLQRVRVVYFPLGAVVSSVVEMSGGHTVETGMIGRDGVIAAEEAIHDNLAFNRLIVQVPGSALVTRADQFRDMYSAHEPLREAVAAYRQLFVAQVQQSAACNAVHYIEKRLCRWLLRVRDLAGDEFSLTQEFMAQMLGVQRGTVSVEAHKLQESRLISYRRGSIEIIDVNGMREAACGCYKNLKKYEDATVQSRDGKHWAIKQIEPIHRHG